MKRETEKKSKLWLWITLALVALLAVAGVVIGIFMQPAGSGDDPKGEVLYWNLDRVKYTENSETGLSTREMGGDGLYHFRFASQGQLMDIATADKQLVNYIDTMDVCGLVLDADGLIVDVLNVKDIAVETAQGFYVKSINGNMVTVNSSIAMNGMDVMFEVTDTTYIMDVRADAQNPGQRVELEIMDKVFVYGSEEVPAQNIFLTERQATSRLYLRADRFYDSTAGVTTREPDENGIYTIPFAIDGEIVELKCKDMDIVTEIDAGTNDKMVMGLTFDEDGYITGTITAAVALRGKLLCTVYHVTAIDGNNIEATSLQIGSEQGRVVNFTLSEKTEIVMNEAGCVDHIGVKVDSLQDYDRIVVWTDMQNNALYIKVDCRTVDVPMYYLKNRQYDSTLKETKRVPDANGYYVYELASEGELVTAKTNDKKIADRIDANSYQFFGLKVENGIIQKYYPPTCVTGGYGVSGTRFVTELQSTIVRIVSGYDIESGGNYMLTEESEVYDVTGAPGTRLGEKTTLQEGDRVIFNRSVTNDITHIYVLDRYYSGCKFYYNASRKFDSTNMVTTRTPDEEGYYVYTMYCEGEEVEVKTKNKDMATIIDEQNAPIVAMRVSNGIVEAAYPAACGQKYTMKVFNYHYVGEITSDNVVSTYYFSNGERTESAYSFKMASDCQIYNVSTFYNNHRGEKSTLRVGDRIQALRDIQTGELTHIWIMQRSIDSPLYMHTNRIKPTDGITNRVPNAEGYYTVDLFFDGKIKTFKTKDAELMGRVDSFGAETFFTMEVDGDIILAVGSANNSKNAASNVVSSRDVMKISGKTVTAVRMRPGQPTTGASTVFTYSSNTKIYNVSYYAGEARWKEAELEEGDRIVVYADSDGNITYIFIMYPHMREEGYLSKCPHCNETVWWEPYFGSFIQTEEVVHYYQPADYGLNQGTVGKALSATTEVPRVNAVFDMNGCTLTGSTGRNFLVYGDLTIIDTVGGGVLQANGSEGSSGGNFLVIGGSVTVCDGVIIRQNDSPDATAGKGGNFYVSKNSVKCEDGTIKTNVGKVILKDAVLEAWNCKNGGNILLNAGTELTVNKATITGGDIMVAADAKVKLNGSNIKISGEGLDLTSGATIKESKLSGSSKVVVQAKGIFTEKLSNANAQKAYYEAEYRYYPIEVRDSALWTDKDPSKPDYVDEPEIPALPEVTSVNNSALVLDANSRAKCPVCGNVVTWTAITDTSKAQTLVNGTHYYLSRDLTFSKADLPYIQVESGVSACLHLNNHNITATKAMAILVNGSLNIMGNGTVSGNGYDNEGLITRPDLHGATLETSNSKAVVNIYGGTYIKSAANDTRVTAVTKNGTTTDTVCANSIVEIHGNGGTINMFEGAVVDGRNTKKSSVQTYGGMFNLYGGTVYGGSGAAVNAANWQDDQSGGVSVYGGTIQADSGAALRGNGAANGPAYLHIYGGQIRGTTSFNANTELILAGSPVLTRLEQPTDKNGSYEGKVILGKLTDGASIKVNGTEEISFQNKNAASYVQYFESLTDTEIVHLNFAVSFYYVPVPELPEVPEVMPALTEDLQFIEDTPWALCPICEEYVVWTAITQETYGAVRYNSGNALPNGTHLYLAEDITYTASSSFVNSPSGSSNTACLHLNGHNFTATETNVISGNTGTLNILGSGTVSGNGGNGATIVINTTDGLNGGVVLHTGTYTKASGNGSGVVQINSNGGRIKVCKDAAIVTDAGTLAAKVAGGKLTTGHLILEGTVEGGYVESGNVHTDKKGEVILEINGADLQGGAKVASDTVLRLSAGTKISGEGLDLTSGVKIAKSELTEGAQIEVIANGIFTEVLDNVNDQLAFYTAAIGYYPIEVRESALWTERDPSVPEFVDEPEIPALPELLSVDNSALVLDENNQAKCPVCGEVVTWTAITDNSEAQTLADGTHYYLSGDLTFDKADLPYIQVESGVSACLHLNDHNITATKAMAILVNGSLNIMGNGIVSGNGYDNEGLITRPDLHGATLETSNSDAVVNIYGGTYVKSAANDTRVTAITKSGKTTDTVCANNLVEIHGNGGTINMFEGAVIDGRNTNKSTVHSYAGMFNLYGGTVYGGSGAAVYAGNWSSTKSGGISIYGGTVQADSGAALRGVGAANGPAYLHIYGGQINGTTGFNANTEVILAGSPVLTRLDQPADKDGTYEGKVILGKLTEGASIKVNGTEEISFPNKNAESYVQYFESLTDTEIVALNFAVSFYYEPDAPDTGDTAFDNSDLVFEEGTNKARCPLCDEVVEWIALTQDANGTTGTVVTAADQHYYLAEDITYTGSDHFIKAPGSNRKLCIHLNGHNFTGTKARFLFGYSSQTSIMGNGIVATGMDSPTRGGISFNTNNQGNVSIDLYGGTYTVTEDNTDGSPIAIENNGGNITIHEGVTVIGSDTAPAIYVGSSNARLSVLTVVGATIEGSIEIKDLNTEKGFSTTVVLEDAKVDAVKLGKDVSFTLSGDTVIDKLEVAEGAKITVGELGTAAMIDVSGNGTISEPNDKMSDYLGNFTSSYGCQLSVVDNALVAQSNAAAVDNSVLAISRTAWARALFPVTMFRKTAALL